MNRKYEELNANANVQMALGELTLPLISVQRAPSAVWYSSGAAAATNINLVLVALSRNFSNG